MLEIFRAGLNSILTKTLGMKPGADSPAPILTPEITPGITLESDRPEWKFLANEAMWSGWQEITLGMGVTAGAFGVTNPAGSNQLVILEYLDVESESLAVCSTYGLWLGVLTWTQNLRVYPNDIRFSVAAGLATYGGYSPIIFSTKNDAAQSSIVEMGHLDTTGARHTLVAGNINCCRPIILSPGTCFVLNVFLQDNGSMSCSVGGRIRELQPNEMVQG